MKNAFCNYYNVNLHHISRPLFNAFNLMNSQWGSHTKGVRCVYKYLNQENT